MYLLTNRSASSQTEPVIRAKMASSQSYEKQKHTLYTSLSDAEKIETIYHEVYASYFSVLVQQQSSF